MRTLLPLLPALATLLTLCEPSIAAGILSPRKSSCAANYEACAAKGAKSDRSPPGIGDGMRGLYNELVESVEGHSLKGARAVLVMDGDGVAIGKRDKEFCCRSGMSCLLLKGRELSFCWDKFTTNYFFADGSYGSITTGEYTTGSKDVINLISGNYTKADGEKGTIYDNTSDQPNLSSLKIPNQFTATGEGSAIPGSELGAPTVIQGTTRGATTIPATTFPATTVDGTVVPPSTRAASTREGTTVGPATKTVTVAPPAKSSGGASGSPVQTTGSWLFTWISMLLMACFGI